MNEGRGAISVESKEGYRYAMRVERIVVYPELRLRLRSARFQRRKAQQQRKKKNQGKRKKKKIAVSK